MMPRVAIIYLAYNNRSHLPDVIESWKNIKYPHEEVKIFVVPNDAIDSGVEYLKKNAIPESLKTLPEIEIIDDGVNRGFSGGNNIAIRQALDEGFDYIYLQNGDLKLDKHTITEVVKMAERDDEVGSVQSLIMYWNQKDMINSSGNMVHVAGYGYARDNLKKIDELSVSDGDEIMYSSGAGVLFRGEVLKKVGLLEEGFFMYHEDLELGLRIKIAGYKNVIAVKSIAFHDYSFSRNTKKFAWTELYRWVVILSYYKTLTLIMLAPLLFVIEFGTWLMAFLGGWIGAKIWAYKQFFLPKTWRLIGKIRRRTNRLRKISDRELLNGFVGVIEAQESSNWIVDRIANPVVDFIWKISKFLIIW